MRRYLLASLIGHLAFTLVGSLLSLSLLKPPPAFTTMRVDLQSMTMPERELARPVDEPEPAAEEPEPAPPSPADVVRQESPPVPEELAPEPERETALSPPEPELPREPQKPEPEPEPERVSPQELDLPEPENVTRAARPREESQERPTEAVSQAEPEDLGRGAAVQASSTEGVEDYYLALVQRKIGLRWKPTPASSSGRSNVAAVVYFRIGPQGEVIAPSIGASSGLSVFDRQALGAVIEAAPLPKPPPRFARSGLEIHFRFVYNPQG